jgi:hypothetical protein
MPILVIVIYCVFLTLPDQTAEAIRTTFEAGIWSLLLVLLGWYLLTIYFVLVLVGATLLGLNRLLEKQGADKLDRFQTGVVYAFSIAPLVTLCIAVVTSLNLSLSFNLSLASFSGLISSLLTIGQQLLENLPALYFLFGLVVLLRMDHNRNRVGGEPVRAAVFGVVFVALVLIVLRIVSAVFGVTADPPPVLSFTGWMALVLAALMLVEYLSRRWHFPLLSTGVIAALLFAAFDWSDNPCRGHSRAWRK